MKKASGSVKILERRFEIFPSKFSWRGRIYRVDTVNECKTTTHRQGIQATFHYWVRCNDQIFHLSEAVPSGCWSVHPQ